MGTLLFLNMFTLKILPPCHNHTPHKQQIRNNNQSITRHIYTCSTVDRLGRRWVGDRNSQKMDEWSSQFLHTALPTTVHRLNLGITNGSPLVLLRSQLYVHSADSIPCCKCSVGCPECYFHCGLECQTPHECGNPPARCHCVPPVLSQLLLLS